MTNKRWFHVAVAIISTLVVIKLVIDVAVIFEPLFILLSTISIPLLFGGLLYYISLPFKLLLERNGFGRLTSITTIVIMLLITVGVVLSMIIPAIINEVKYLIANWPFLQYELNRLIRILSLQAELLPVSTEEMTNNFLGDVNEFIRTILSNLLTILASTIGTLFMVIIIPFFSFFMLKDHEKFIPAVTKPFKGRLNGFLVETLIGIDAALKSFISGRILASIFRSLIIFVGFGALRLDYALLLAFAALFLNVIPFLGMWITFFISLSVSLIQEPVMAIWVSVILIASFYIENNYITPQLVSDKLKIHPLTVITLVVTAGNFSGLIGVILSLPLYMLVKEVVVNIFCYGKDLKTSMFKDVQGEKL